MRKTVFGALLATAMLLSAFTTASASAACVSAEAPYKHVRVTSQKMVYAHTRSVCALPGSPTTTARLQKWNGSAWVWYGSTASGTTDALANEFLCNNYGWGGSGSGYFRNYGTLSYNTPRGRVVEAAYSGYRYLSC